MRPIPLYRKGSKMARLGRRRLFTDQQLIELHAKEFNDREIGEKLGTARSTVNYHRRRLGLKAIRKRKR